MGKTLENTGMAADESQKHKRGNCRCKERRQKKFILRRQMDLCDLKNSELELQYQKYKKKIGNANGSSHALQDKQEKQAWGDPWQD